MKNKGLKFYRKGENFIYITSSDYLIELNFELSEIDLVQIMVTPVISLRYPAIDWRSYSIEIKEKEFLKYYKIAQKLNPFTPEL